jgi:hypothetical protein
MIDDKHKFIFVHIPKCAGTSVYKALLSGLDENNDINNTKHGGWDAKNKIYKQHATALQTKEFYCSGFYNYFRFTFTRNPWSRAISDYLWMTNTDVNSSREMRKGTFSEYLNNKNDFNIKNLKNKSFYRYDHILPQTDFILDENGQSMVNFIGKIENLQQDFNTVCDKIGIPQQELPHANKTNHKHYTEYYDDETREIVAQKYARDIECFGYKFGD